MAVSSKWMNYRGSRWRRHAVTLMVWMLAVTGVLWLFARRTQQFDALGIARGESRQIASVFQGRLVSVPVQLYENVAFNDPVALLEDERVKAQIATAAAQTMRLRAELNATRDRLQAEIETAQEDRQEEARRFEVDVETAQLDILELTTILETDRIDLELLQVRLEIFERLKESGNATPFELEQVQYQVQALEAKVAANQKLLAQQNVVLTEARERRTAYADLPEILLLASGLEPLREAINAQERLLDELRLDQASTVITSPMNGTVSQILRGIGEVVRAGEPILTVAAQQPSEIIAYAQETQMGSVYPGLKVEITRQGEPREVIESEVVQVGPVVEQMPPQLWQNPNFPQWGRPVRIALPTELKLIPGETIRIRGRKFL